MFVFTCHSVLLHYKFDPNEHVGDVCVTGVDGATTAPSAAVAHASTSVSTVKKQTTITSFFKSVTSAVQLKLCPGFVHVSFACRGLKRVQILQNAQRGV